MTISFILNGEDKIVRTDADKRLVYILRDNFALAGTRTGCLTGNCGSCSIIFNGDVVKSCLIPAYKIQGGEIITIEGFLQTDEYHDIRMGFSETGIENCGFCNTGKILAVEALLSRNLKPTETEILTAFHGIKCRCTEPEELVKGIIAAINYRRRRIYGRST